MSEIKLNIGLYWVANKKIGYPFFQAYLTFLYNYAYA